MNVISKDELIRGLLDVKALEGGLADSRATKKAISGVLPIYKEWGKTPLEALDELQIKYPILAGVPLSYAGRLDPLAEGLMLVLVGETNKDRERYLHLDKKYEVEILFGIKTDTGDLFGIPKGSVLKTAEASDFNNFTNVTTKDLDAVLKSYIGKQQFPYPVYSSKTVQGKPLFQWMNEGRIDEIEIPKTDVEIYSLKLLGTISKVSGVEVLEKVQNALVSVKGDFRYGEINSEWYKTISDLPKDVVDFSIIKIQCECSSGTYMRALAEEIGKKFGTASLAYSIKRIEVGGVDMNACIN